MFDPPVAQTVAMKDKGSSSPHVRGDCRQNHTLIQVTSESSVNVTISDYGKVEEIIVFSTSPGKRETTCRNLII